MKDHNPENILQLVGNEVALGTSLPDTFASKAAAQQDRLKKSIFQWAFCAIGTP